MKYLLLSLISAMLLSISWPTYGIPFFIFFALVPLLLMEHDITHFSKIKNKSLTIFGLTYLCFFIWNIVTTGWLYGAKNPDGSHSMMAVVFPVLFNSFFYAAIFQLFHYYKKAQGTYFGLVFFVAIWMVFEKVHLSWEFTWPWLNLGNVFSEYPKMIQWYDTLGATGGSFWILLINVYVFYTIRIYEAGRKRKSLITNIAVLAAFIFIPMGISLLKYNNFEEKPIGQVNVLMLQPDLDPYNEKYSKDSLTILSELLTLAQENATGQVDYFIGPETSLPGYGSISERGFEQSLLLNQVKGFLSSHPKSIFATGISSHRFYSRDEKESNTAYQTSAGSFVDSYNSAVQIIPNQKVEVYHKGKLVPGVELFPYINVLKPLLGDSMIDLGGTTASLGMDPERKVFTNSFNQGKLAPIICYESIYGEFVTDYIKKGANFLAIMTNDSWWGETQGHEQLMSYAKLRAIETRREIARAANSGISAHIDARGEVVADTFYGDKTTLFAKVNLYEKVTFYTKAGDLLSRLSIFVLGFLVFYTLIKKYQNRKPPEPPKKIVIKR
ncbi:apolipoprotein N-acyltransferase [Chryseobacterium sp. MP_3.2]|uniref:apolipoprotein N-acyltransferase n=1 Tax=Chryseobacterium sp. MP_3.2 TaxID=3071712 RepID=UPI002E0C9B60|nr:apolipoprotein N-acyltransferase [Chryseobacterium sp. MP_3.2]